MRLLVMFALLTGPCMIFGWPNHWIMAAAGFAAGLIAAASSDQPNPARRGGYVIPPGQSESDLARRVTEYAERESGRPR